MIIKTPSEKVLEAVRQSTLAILGKMFESRMPPAIYDFNDRLLPYSGETYIGSVIEIRRPERRDVPSSATP